MILNEKEKFKCFKISIIVGYYTKKVVEKKTLIKISQKRTSTIKTTWSCK